MFVIVKGIMNDETIYISPSATNKHFTFMQQQGIGFYFTHKSEAQNACRGLASLLQNSSFSLTPQKGFSSPLPRRLISCSTFYIIIVHASQHYDDAAHSCLVPYTRECLFRRRQPSKFAVYSWQQIIRGIGRPELEHGRAITLRSSKTGNERQRCSQWLQNATRHV